MKAQNTTIREFLDGTKQFVIPVFQRDYTWEEGNWRQIWDDLCHDGAVGGGPGHFVGSIVHVNDSPLAAMNRSLVIDGQQRLTTFSILCAALRDHIRSAGWDGVPDGPTPEQIDGMLLRNHLQSGDAAYKLVLRRADAQTLRAVVDCKSYDTLAGVRSDLIARAYDYFRHRLASPETNLSEVWHGVVRTRIVEIGLELPADDPQSIFESMNSTGVSLTPGDLIRNYLLMGLAEQEQNDLYTEYWSKIEGYFRENGNLDDGLLNAFLLNYIALKRKDRQQLRPNQIYTEFKKSRTTIQGENTLEQLLGDMRRFAGYFAAFEGRLQISSKELTEAMRSTRSQGNTPRVLIMRLYDCYDNQQTLTEREFIRSLRLIESYILRHTICGHQIRSFWRIFAEMSLDIDEATPAESLRHTLAKPRGSYGFWSFQSDFAFSKAIQTTNLAQFQICKYILERLESFDTKEPIPTSKLTIEHIMPQGLTDDWKEMLGKDWEQVHSGWLHRLGNLTLTGYNPDMSNNSFEKKKAFYDKSPLRLTEYVRKQSQWTAAEMETRGNQLAERALRIWPYPGQMRHN